MFFLRMALRNVFRQYGRTALSMVSIVFGVAVIILSRGLTSGFKENIIRAQIDTLSGHVLAVPDSYPDMGLRYPVDDLIVLDADTRAWLDSNSQAWTSRVMFTPRAVMGPDAVRVPAYGFDPERDEAVFPRGEWKVEGVIPSKVEEGVLVSRGLAGILSLKLGDTFVLENRTSAGAINALQVKVAGVLSTGSPMIDQLGVFVPKPLVDELVRPGEGVSHVAMRLANRADADSVAAGLRERLGAQARITTWDEASRALVEAQDLRQVMLDVIALALVAIAATGIANTVLMAAYERVKEIGTLRAMGMTQRGVLAVFLTEGMVMGMVGSLLGAALGGGLVWKYARDGMDLSALMAGKASSGSMNTVPFSTMLYMQFSGAVIGWAVLFGLLVAVVASIYPARIAASVQPAEAVRAE